MAEIIERPAKNESGASTGGDGRSFGEIDADELEQARHDPVVRRFAHAAERYFASLKRDGRIR